MRDKTSSQFYITLGLRYCALSPPLGIEFLMVN